MVRMCLNRRAAMSRGSRCVVWIVWLLGCYSAAAGERTSQDGAETLSQLTRTFVHADSAHVAKQAFDKLHGNASQDLIRSLRNGPDDTVAVAVEWKHLFEQRKAQTKKPEQELTYPAHVLWKFFGFLEGRSQCDLPAWWRRHFYFRHVVPPECRLADRQYPQDVRTLEEADGMYRIEVQGHTIEIPIEEKGRKAPAPFAVGQGRVYVALQSQHNADYRLLCFDIETESLVWDEWVWVHVGARPGYGGLHMAEVLLWDNRVAVFGVSGEGNYVAIFKAKTGSSLLRFTPALARTADWYVPSADSQQENE